MLVLFCIGICTNVLWAQKTVSGVVMEKEVNMPLIGCNVVEKGTTNGTVTDLDGKYTLTVGDNATIEFSYIGMMSVEEVVGDRTVINVDMNFRFRRRSKKLLLLLWVFSVKLNR